MGQLLSSPKIDKSNELDSSIIDPNLPLENMFELIKNYGPKKREKSKENPSFDPLNFKNYSSFCNIFGWSVPSLSSLNAISEFCGSDKVLSIGDGL